jgi:hypothetical protein
MRKIGKAGNVTLRLLTLDHVNGVVSLAGCLVTLPVSGQQCRMMGSLMNDTLEGICKEVIVA